MSIADNVARIKEEIPGSVAIVAASKTRTVEEISEAIDAGIEIIGENYVQEAEEKFRVLKGKVKFYCIGHLQTNKVKRAVEIFDMIQTVDSLKIAKEIDKRCKDIDKVMPVLIEVNSGGERQKSGVLPDEAVNLINEIKDLKNIKIKGLMTMAPFFDDAEKARHYFKRTKELFDRIKGLETLSMGMSDSYKIAIEEGSNMVRIGTRIFGKREY